MQTEKNYETRFSINSILKDEIKNNQQEWQKQFESIDLTCDLDHKIMITLYNNKNKNKVLKPNSQSTQC
jgi:plasmid rolling circle replication initiator protein Rep